MKKLKYLLSLLAFVTTLSFAAAGYIGTNTQYPIIFNAAGPITQIAPFVPIAGATMTGPLNLSGDPTISTQAATKNYVDSVATGLKPIGAVAATTTANLTATYANGASGVGATLTNSGTQAAFATDGYTASLNDLILVSNQTTLANNGIYKLTTVGSGATNWVLTRWTSYDAPSEIVPGSLVSVTNGTIFAGASFYEVNTITTVGTDPIVFASFFTPSSFLQVSRNLGDLGNPITARTNLGLGSIATHPTTDFVPGIGTSTANDLPTFADTTGRILQDSGISISAGALNMHSHLINNVTDPSSAQDAATKNYVDGRTLTAVDVASSTQTMQQNKMYFADDGSTLIIFTMPATCTFGAQMQVVGVGSGGFSIHVATGGTINFAGVIAQDAGSGASVVTQAIQQAGNTITLTCFSDTLAFVTASSGKFLVVN